MSEPFMGEIRVFSFNHAPSGWAFCNGQFLPINQNQALFSLLGTTYGGNGQTTFALPDLRGRVPVDDGDGDGFDLGEVGGEQAHSVTTDEVPAHTHLLRASPATATTGNPSTTRVLAASAGANAYAPATNLVAMASDMLSTVGGSQAHLNMQPFLTLTFCIALQGIFPDH